MFRDEIEQLGRTGIVGTDVLIGHLDTAVDVLHPNLIGQVAEACTVSADGFDLHPGMVEDPALHGTHVASVMVGRAHRHRDRGVAPGARLVSATVIERGSVVARIAKGLDWLAGLPVGVVCIPCGLPTPNPILDPFVRTLIEQDVVVVAPSGNGGAGTCLVPGSYPSVLSIGAADGAGRVASFSGSLNDASGNPLAPEVLAPGVGVVGAVPGGSRKPHSGTSIAAAQIAGLAALLRSAMPEAPASTIVSSIRASALPTSDEQSHRARSGVVSPQAALDTARYASPTAPVSPTPSERFVDERLLRRLELDEEGIVDALVAFDESTISAVDLGGLETSRFKNMADVLLVRGPGWRVAELVSLRTVRVASATDVDRLHTAWPRPIAASQSGNLPTRS